MPCSLRTVLLVLLSVAIQTPSVWTCGGGSGSSTPCNRDTLPPTISCPPSVGTVYGGSQQRQVSVCWKSATATDNCGVQSVTQTSGLPSCSSFGSGQYSVGFTATDRSGHTASCVMSFTVTITTCPYMDYPANAQSITYSSLNQQPVYGDKAVITCKVGYTLSGPSTQTCTAYGSWSAGGSRAIACTVVKCPTAIPTPAYMYVVNTTGYSYGSVANLACNNQLTLTGGLTYFTCQSSGAWSTTSAICIDSVPPVIWGCPASIYQYSDRGLNYTRVNWTVPTATDNLNTSVTVKLTTGLPPGSIFYESLVPYTIRYDARDSAGNAALPCIFTIVISGTVLTCDPLGIPMSAHEWQKCDNGYRLGSSCTLGCSDGYQLVGPSTVTCDIGSSSTSTPFWNWGPSGNASYCQVIQCPPLNAPKNGALTCSNWVNGPLCQLQCNETYDIPEMAAAALGLGVGMYACSTITGTWMPSPPVPDCSVKHYPSSAYLMNILSYNSGDCSTPEAQTQIANNFIEVLNDTSTAFTSACINVPACTASNVQVTCGATGRRRRRQAVAFTVTFQLTIYLPDNITMDGTAVYSMVSSIFDAMTTQIQDDVDAGKYDTLGIPGVNLDPSSYIYSNTKLNCPLGMAPRLSTFTCAPCGQGTFFNTTADKCQWCNKGTYQDDVGQFSCKACPATYSTLDIAATAASQCLPPCPAGSYSQSGLQPCGLCQPGYYQPSTGQTSCLQCPPGQASVTPGALGALAC